MTNDNNKMELLHMVSAEDMELLHEASNIGESSKSSLGNLEMPRVIRAIKTMGTIEKCILDDTAQKAGGFMIQKPKSQDEDSDEDDGKYTFLSKTLDMYILVVRYKLKGGAYPVTYYTRELNSTQKDQSLFVLKYDKEAQQGTVDAFDTYSEIKNDPKYSSNPNQKFPGMKSTIFLYGILADDPTEEIIKVQIDSSHGEFFDYKSLFSRNAPISTFVTNLHTVETTNDFGKSHFIAFKKGEPASDEKIPFLVQSVKDLKETFALIDEENAKRDRKEFEKTGGEFFIEKGASQFESKHNLRAGGSSSMSNLLEDVSDDEIII